MKTAITARVTLTIEMTVSGENWNANSSIEQVHREGTEKAVEQLKDICSRSRSVRLVGTPVVEALIVNK